MFVLLYIYSKRVKKFSKSKLSEKKKAKSVATSCGTVTHWV